MGKRDLESTIYIVDLAGSERQSKTGVTGEQAIRLGHPAVVATLMRPPPYPPSAVHCPLGWGAAAGRVARWQAKNINLGQTPLQPPGLWRRTGGLG